MIQFLFLVLLSTFSLHILTKDVYLTTKIVVEESSTLTFSFLGTNVVNSTTTTKVTTYGRNNDKKHQDSTEDDAEGLMVIIFIVVIARLCFTQFGQNAPFSPPVTVFLGYNKLTSISNESIEGVASCCCVLDVRDNQLTDLPTLVCQMVELKTLDVTNNTLSDLPAGLGYLPKLNRLLLEGNPFRRIRRSIISSGHEALKKFLRTRGAAPNVTTTSAIAQPTTVAIDDQLTYKAREANGNHKLVLENVS